MVEYFDMLPYMATFYFRMIDRSHDYHHAFLRIAIMLVRSFLND